MPPVPAEAHDTLIFDSHSHAASEASALLSARIAGSLCLVSAGETEWETTAAAAAEAAAGGSDRDIRYALGVHPWYVHEQRSGWEDRLRTALQASSDAIVGECGLDRVRLDAPLDAQLKALSAQLHLATELRRALVVHCVRADGVLMDLLREQNGELPPVLVMHAFGGSAETADGLLRLGAASGCRFYFGFSGRAARLKRAAAVMASLPAERLLLESDGHTAEESRTSMADACMLLCAARGWTPEQAIAQTAANAKEALAVHGWQ